MRISIKSEEQTYFDNEVEQDTVVIGRGSETDIRCLHEGISRKHLEIKRNGDQAEVTLLSSNNWALLDDEKINPGAPYPFLSVNEITLPGNILVRIEFDPPEEPLDSVHNNSLATPLNQAGTQSSISKSPLRARKRGKSKRKSDSEKLEPQYVAMAALTAFFWLYFLVSGGKIPFIE